MTTYNSNSSTSSLGTFDTPQVLLTGPSTPNSSPKSNCNRRKFSFPVALHSSLLLGDSTTLSARRRLSNVSDVVTRKLSSTIGWKHAAIPAHDIITQGKCLCGQYIRHKLKRAGIFNRKLGLQRIRSILGTPSHQVVRDVFQTLNLMGEELERMHPRVYTNIARQVSRETAGDLNTEESAPVLISAVGRYLFKNDITWSKVISLFAIAGGLAVDLVRQGHPDYLSKLIESVGEVIEDELVPFINENGGWTGLNVHVKAVALTDFRLFEYCILVGGCIAACIVMLWILKYVGCNIIWNSIKTE